MLASIDVDNIHRKLTIPARSQLFFELFSLKWCSINRSDSPLLCPQASLRAIVALSYSIIAGAFCPSSLRSLFKHRRRLPVQASWAPSAPFSSSCAILALVFFKHRGPLPPLSAPCASSCSSFKHLFMVPTGATSILFISHRRAPSNHPFKHRANRRPANFIQASRPLMGPIILIHHRANRRPINSIQFYYVAPTGAISFKHRADGR